MGIAFMTLSMVVYTLHVTCQDIDGGATEADGGASTPVSPSVATPLLISYACLPVAACSVATSSLQFWLAESAAC